MTSDRETAPLRFVTLGQLASGGMGTVLLARLEGDLERLVAVKRMHPHLARDAQIIAMFLDEIWMTRSLRHPNVVTMLGWGVDRDGPHIVSELVVGLSLRELHRAGRDAGEPPSPQLCAYVGAQIARGLHAAYHLEGDDGAPLHIVHRDVTPSNVLIGFDGSVKLTDFGVAKAAHKITKSLTGTLKGKVAFMAPEYIRARKLDARSDLYSLGVLMYELLAGKRPFSVKGEVEMMRAIAEQPPPPLGATMEVAEPLAAVVDKLRAREPDERFASGEDVALALEAWLLADGSELTDWGVALSEYCERHGADHRRRIDELRREGGASTPVSERPPPEEDQGPALTSEGTEILVAPSSPPPADDDDETSTRIQTRRVSRPPKARRIRSETRARARARAQTLWGAAVGVALFAVALACVLAWRVC